MRGSRPTRLTLTKNCKIFQKLSVPEILRQVFADFGVSDFRLALTKPGGYEVRDYCVQYEETAFKFVSRLMEDEGLFYFFEHQADQHVLVIADDLSAHKLCPGIFQARYLQVTNDSQPEEAMQQQVTTNEYTLDDFNFETPSTQLRSSIQSLQSAGRDLRIYEYAAGFDKKVLGAEKVKWRIQGHECQVTQLEGQGHCLSFASGYRFQLINYPRADWNQEYVLRWVSHNLSSP